MSCSGLSCTCNGHAPMSTGLGTRCRQQIGYKPRKHAASESSGLCSVAMGHGDIEACSPCKQG